VRGFNGSHVAQVWDVFPLLALIAVGVACCYASLLVMGGVFIAIEKLAKIIGPSTVALLFVVAFIVLIVVYP